MRHNLNTSGMTTPSINNSVGVIAGAVSTGGNNFMSCNVNGSKLGGVLFGMSAKLAGSN